jgi:ABC-2 type transport system ATP-binding protein
VKGPFADAAAQSIVTTTGLTKRYGSVRALTDVTLSVGTGEVFGLLGPNGSGKTTTIRLLIGLLRPTAGRSNVAGYDSWRRGQEVRRFVSFLPGELRLPGSMTGLKLLKYLCALRGGAGLERAVAIAESVMELDLRRRVRTYSTGMKQKLALAQAFADPVEVLVLDEPTASLDPSARGLVIQLVREARASGQTVIFSGHVISEVEEVSDRVAILREGRLMHVEDMNARRNLRMLLVRFRDGQRPEPPAELALTLRGMQGDAQLLEHRGEIGSLLSWLATQPVEDVAIGTDDLRSLYDRYHNPGAAADGPPAGAVES